MKEWLDMWRKGFEFKGRATRKEYWMAWLIYSVMLIIIFIIEGVLELNFEYSDYGPISLIFILITFIPMLALGTRRLHDVGRSGLVQIFGPFALYYFFKESKKEDNCYGEYKEDNSKFTKIFVRGIFIITIISLVLIVGAVILSLASSDTYEGSNATISTFQEQLQVEINQENSKCPYIEGDIRVNSISLGSENNVIYNFTTVNYSKEQLDLTILEKGIRENGISTLKTGTDLEAYKENNVVFSWVVYDNVGNYLLEVTITPSEYND